MDGNQTNCQFVIDLLSDHQISAKDNQFSRVPVLPKLPNGFIFTKMTQRNLSCENIIFCDPFIRYSYSFDDSLSFLSFACLQLLSGFFVDLLTHY